MGAFLLECERSFAKSPCYQAVFPSGNKFAMICKDQPSPPQRGAIFVDKRITNESHPLQRSVILVTNKFTTTQSAGDTNH